MGEWVAVIRDPRFSPNAVEKDRAILQAVADRLGGALMLEEQDLLSLPNHDLKGKKWLSMGRRPETLDFLRMRVGQGALVINNPEGVARCKRTILRRVMENLAVPVPPKSGTYGHWVKRDDGAAQTAADIVYVPPKDSLQAHIDDFLRRGRIGDEDLFLIGIVEFGQGVLDVLHDDLLHGTAVFRAGTHLAVFDVDLGFDLEQVGPDHR